MKKIEAEIFRLSMKMNHVKFMAKGVNYIEMWWSGLWMTKEEKVEIKESLRKRRESGGCSMWRNYLKDHPEAAKYDWEKEFIK